MPEGRPGPHIPGRLSLALQPLKNGNLGFETQTTEGSVYSSDKAAIDEATLEMIHKITKCTTQGKMTKEFSIDESKATPKDQRQQLHELENQLQEMDRLFQWATKMKNASEQVWIKWKQTQREIQ